MPLHFQNFFIICCRKNIWEKTFADNCTYIIQYLLVKEVFSYLWKNVTAKSLLITETGVSLKLIYIICKPETCLKYKSDACNLIQRIIVYSTNQTHVTTHSSTVPNHKAIRASYTTKYSISLFTKLTVIHISTEYIP